MKLLILSFYYEPDLSAGSFRTTSLVSALLEQMPADYEIELVSTLPNRYSSFSNEALAHEQHPQLTIHRVALPEHQSGMVDQSKAFIAYARGVIKQIKGKRYDLIFATSSRLMTASLGAYIARRIGSPLYLDIRDIFVDTIKDVLPGKFTWALKPIFSQIEAWTIHSATKVNLVSGGFLPYFKDRYPEGSYSCFTNGIDDEFIKFTSATDTILQKTVLEVVYAGNIGEGQGLHTIIPALSKRFKGYLNFKLVGDGGRRRQLEEALALAGCSNVEILAPVKRDKLIEMYKSSDILFLHLNNYEAFKKVLPSKLFEYAALGKPIWAGVAGHAADFINQYIDNAAVFSPCDVESAVQSFAKLSLTTEPRTAFVKRFSRSNIMGEMATDIISLIEKQ